MPPYAEFTLVAEGKGSFELVEIGPTSAEICATLFMLEIFFPLSSPKRAHAIIDREYAVDLAIERAPPATVLVDAEITRIQTEYFLWKKVCVTASGTAAHFQ